MNDVERAIAATEREVRVQGQVRLASGHIIGLNLPGQMTAEDVLDLILRLPGAVSQANQRATAGGIALPDGRVVPVPRVQ